MMALTGAVATATFAPHQPVDLAETVRDALRNAADAAKSKGIDLSWQSATDRAVLSEVGALSHAIARIIDGALAMKRVCVDGPVFDADAVFPEKGTDLLSDSRL